MVVTGTTTKSFSDVATVGKRCIGRRIGPPSSTDLFNATEAGDGPPWLAADRGTGIRI
ncbi:hypothetical protein SAMN05446635_0475 [Burkholderia sp. OK233]|nr:hypothetical protein SAMN05446635_0475 [Burkholderia sp. OK233]